MDINSIQSNIIDTIKFGEIYNPSEILINLIIAFFLGFIISLVYKKTHKGLSYSQSFVLTNIFIYLYLVVFFFLKE